MNTLKYIRFSSILLALAMVISILSCGEDEENPPENFADVTIGNPVEVETQPAQNQPGSPDKIRWVKFNKDGTRTMLKEFEDYQRIKGQNTFVVRVTDANDVPVPNIRVEWILNRWPDAVGDIVETDDPGFVAAPADVDMGNEKGNAAPQIKVNNTFAITFTNSEPETIKVEGRDGTYRDLNLDIGETWITITSTDEGETKITAFCPAIPAEKEHKIFAVKHWTCINLTPPTSTPTCINYRPAPDDTANTETLVSIINSACDGNPMPGKRVRYTIQPVGPDAVWDENNDKIYEVISDGNGEARATIKLDPLPGPDPVIDPNAITVEVLDDNNMPDAREDISKDWGSAFLAIEMPLPVGSGPGGAFGACDEVKFDITVENTGECDAGNVMVNLEYPAEAFDLVPPAKLPTSVGTLSPGKSAPVSVKLRTKKIGTWSVKAKAESAEGVSAETSECKIIVVRILSLACRRQPETPLTDDENEATITLTVGNPCTYDVEGSYDLTATLPSIVKYVPGSASPPDSVTLPPDAPDGQIIWNISTIKARDNPFTFEVEGISSGVDKIEAKLSNVEATCEISIQVIKKPNLVLKCEETKARRDDGEEFGPPVGKIIELVEDTPDKDVATITLSVFNNESHIVEGGYELTVTLPDVVEYVPGSVNLLISEPEGNMIIWKDSTTEKNGLKIPAKESKKFTFKVKEKFVGGPEKIEVELSKVKVEPQTCEEKILVQVLPKCSLVLNPPSHVIRVIEGGTEKITFILRNEGAKDAFFVIDKPVNITPPEGLMVTEIAPQGIILPKGITIPTDKPNNEVKLIITVIGITAHTTAYSVIVEGTYFCDVGEERPLTGTATVLVIE